MTRFRIGQIVAVGVLASAVASNGWGQSTVRVSVTGAGEQARGGTYTPRPVISANGSVVAFESPITSLVPDDTNDVVDIFVAAGGPLTRVVGIGGAQLDCAAQRPSLSETGQFLAFDSCATNAVLNDTNNASDVFVVDRSINVVTRVSVASGGGQVSEQSFAPAISPNGRYVAFLSNALGLAPGGSASVQVYLHDRDTAQTTLVSRESGAGAVGNEPASGRPSVSNDGHVAFTSAATNLLGVGNDTNGVTDVFVREFGGTTSRVSVSDGGGELGSPASSPSISADGRLVAFTTAAPAVAADTNPLNDVYLRDRTAGRTVLVSRTQAGTAANGSSFEPVISANGAFVAFSSLATDLAGPINAVVDVYRAALNLAASPVAVDEIVRFSIGIAETTGSSTAPGVASGGNVVFASDSSTMVAGDTNGDTDVFVAAAPGSNVRLTVTAPGLPETYSGQSTRPQPSFSGNVVAFLSSATNLVPDDFNGSRDVFVRDIAAGTTERVPVPSGYEAVDADWVSISHDGRWVAYNRIVSFLYDRSTGTTTPVSVASAGSAPVQAAQPKVSPSGRHVAFTTPANLDPTDTNGLFDVYVFDRITGTTTWASRTHTGEVAVGGHSTSPGISGDGRRVVFQSGAGNLVATPVTVGNNIFVRDLVANTTTWVSNLPATLNFDARDPAISADGTYVTFLHLTSAITEGTAPSRVYVARADGTGTPRGSLSAVTEGETVNDDAAYDPTLSMFGRYVSFRSYKANLVAGDTNAAADIFARQVLGQGGNLEFGSAVLATVGTMGPATGGSPFSAENPEISGNGSAVAFQAGFTNLVPNDTNGMDDAFVRLGVFAPGECAFYDQQPGFAGYAAWIQGFGVDPCSDMGSPFADPDGDGFTNNQERTGVGGDGNPILGAFTRYFAEGATKNATLDFNLRIALANPNAFPVTGEISYQLPSGVPVTPTPFSLAAFERATIVLDDHPEIGDAGPDTAYEFATTVRATAPIGIDRTMTWDRSVYAGHAEVGVVSPARTWYFAEGATIAGFDLFYLLQNPSSEVVTVEGRYLLGTGQVFTKSYVLTPNSRFNVWANVEQIGGTMPLASAQFSAEFRVTAGPPIIAERAMYRGAAPLFKAGHESAGITEPATEWFLAEGNAGDFFDLFVLIGNTTPNDALIEAQFIVGNTGTVYTRQYPVSRNSRFNIWVDEEELPAGSGNWPFKNGNTDVSVRIRSLNNVPLVVERAMWWPGTVNTWYEAHNSPATSRTAPRWVLGEGEVGGALNWETYVLVANTGSAAGQISIRLLLPGGVTALVPDNPRTMLSASSRTTYSLAELLEAAGLPGNTTAGVLIESVGAPLQLVVERSMYRNLPGQPLGVGTNALGTPLP